MIYFAVSDYVFNTASWVYYQAGYMNFIFRNENVSRGWRRLGVPGESIRWDCRPAVGTLGS